MFNDMYKVYIERYLILVKREGLISIVNQFFKLVILVSKSYELGP